MSSKRRIKRRLLREAVARNVALDQQAPEARWKELAKPRSEPRFGRMRAAFLLLLPAAGLSLAQLRSHAPVPEGKMAAAAAMPTAQIAAKSGSAGPHGASSAEGSQQLAGLIPTSTASSNLTYPAPQGMDVEALPLAVRRVVVDPGHGGEDLGAVAPEGLVEKDVTLDIANRLRELLQERSFEVLMTRVSDHAVPLKERVDFANQQQADIFVSIHLNWIETREVRGVETYYLGPTEDPHLTAMAQRENRLSGYTLSDMKQLLEGIYADVRSDQSADLAGQVQRSLHRSLRRVNPDLRDRGVKKAPFVVLVATDMPAILAEVSCLSNGDEVRLLGKDRYRQSIAEALVRGIESYARRVNQAG